MASPEGAEQAGTADEGFLLTAAIRTQTLRAELGSLPGAS